MEKKLKILIATGIYPPDIGGPAPYALNLKEEFISRGYKVIILSYHLEKKMPVGWRHLFYLFRVVLNLRGVDFIVALDTFSVGMPAVLAAKIFKKKIFIRTGGDFLWESYGERTGNRVVLRKFYEKMPVLTVKEKIIFSLTKVVLRNASAIIFSTNWQREIFEKYYGLDSKKSYIVENYYYGKINAGVEPKEKNFVWIGRKLKLKNINLLKEAFEEAKKQYPGISLEIYAEIPRSRAMEILARCYAFVLPSLSEVSPNLILEAIGFGRPFICTRETGFYEKLKDIGVFIDPTDKADIKDKILFLADDKNYQEIKEKISRFNYSHSWQQIADEFLDIYKSA